MSNNEEIIKEGYTRVSSILSQWDRFGKIPRHILENKQQIGTLIHEAINAHSIGAFLPVDSSIDGYFQSFLEWQKLSKFNLIFPEQRFYCDKLKITGKIDAIAVSSQGELFLIDYKTSASKDARMWQLQGCFYHYLATINKLNLSKRFFFVQLFKDGSPGQAHEFFISNPIANVCKAALLSYRYLNN